MTVRVLGCDQSMTSSGYVILNPDGSVYRNGLIKTAASQPYHLRVARIADSMKWIMTKHHTDVFAMEKPVFGKIIGNSVSMLLGLFHYLKDYIGHETGAKVVALNLTTVKKFATGSGRADKEAMFEALPGDVKELFNALYKKSTGLYDVTDAYWIAKYAQENYG